MRAKLTRDFVNRIEPDPDPSKRLTVWDTDERGFGLTVTPYTERKDGTRGGGVKSYIVQYRPGGRGTPTRRVTIGRHGWEWQPESARREAAEIKRTRRQGIDPFEERRRNRESEQREKVETERVAKIAARLEFKAFAAEFVDRYAKVNQPRSWKGTQAGLADLEKTFAGRRVDELQRDEIVTALKALVKRSPSAGISAHKALRKLYNWAIAETIFAWHPMRNMSPPAANKARTRVLASWELRVIWKAAEQLGYPFGMMFMEIMATGLRLRDVANSVQGEYHAQHEVLIIPSARMKRAPSDVRGDFLVPLNGLALMIPETITEMTDIPWSSKLAVKDRPFFTNDGRRPVSGFSYAKACLDELVDEVAKEEGRNAKIERWTAHDLRRTMSTVMQALGVAPSIIDRMQDHRDKEQSKTALHYQHWDFFDEKRAASELYGSYLLGAIFDQEEHRELVRKVDYRINLDG